MKAEKIDDLLIIFIMKKNIVNLENLCHDVIKKIKKYYNVELKGFYEVNIYIDKKYGAILEFKLEDLDLYYDYNSVDLHIIRIDTNFLYEVDDILDCQIDKFYLYNSNYYININDNNLYNCEFGKIIYHDTKDIINNGKLIIM